MARHIKAGDQLYSLSVVMMVNEVKPHVSAQVHNLIVDGFNNYFVGNSGVLAHDNTIRKPTRAVVPGLLRKAAP